MPDFEKIITGIKKNFNQSYIIVVDNNEIVKEFLGSLKKELNILGSDFTIIGNTSGEKIKIGEIKKIGQRLHLSPQGKINLAAIIEAEFLTTEAANSLLKIVEEPPKKSLILLFTKNCDKIISTIVSRCTKIVLPKSKNYQFDQNNKSLLDNIRNGKNLAQKFRIVGEIITKEMDCKKLLADWSIILRNDGDLIQYRIAYKYLQKYNTSINKKLFLENLILELF